MLVDSVQVGGEKDWRVNELRSGRMYGWLKKEREEKKERLVKKPSSNQKGFYMNDIGSAYNTMGWRVINLTQLAGQSVIHR